MRQEAWVTSAVEDGAVQKAIILAGSLRRVLTAKHLVVMTTLAVTEELREKLKDVFDLVLLLEQKSPNGWSLEDYAKIQAFSLMTFTKCVYVSPNALVMENCDEIFTKYTGFAMANMDLSIFVYSPSTELSRALGKVGDRPNGSLSKCLISSMKNSDVIEDLDEKYNSRLNLSRGTAHHCLTANASIVNFANVYPLELPENILKNGTVKIGTVEKFAAEHCWKIYNEDIKKSLIDNSPSLLPKNKYKNEPIAIVGMSFRLPGGNNVDEFWSLLEEGRNAVVPVPSNRWTDKHSHVHCKNRKVEAGFLNVPIDEIDAKFFGLSPKEAEFLDPQQRLLLEVSWEALEDAMINPLELRGTQAGVFVGSWIHDYKNMLRDAVDVDFFRTYMGNSVASTAARVSHFLETTGPSIATESGCSSAIAAVDLACKSLRNGTSSVGLAGGVNLLIDPFDVNIMEFVISPDYRCKTFDADANGFARAEACAVLVLKRLSDAVRDNDKIWGLVRGTALTQEGLSKSMGTPTIHSESLAMQLALDDAGVHPKDVSYLEAHGTGTAVGDPLEITAIKNAYSPGRTESLVIGSVKTNVGHTESVSGITGIIKVLLSMQHEVIPRHLNLTMLNPSIKLHSIPAKIPLQQVPWPRKDGKPRIAGVSSFGISGTDGHAIIEEPPLIHRRQLKCEMERPLHIIKFSTKSSESMDELLQKYEGILNGDNEVNFANLAYSANIGRATFNHRAVIIAGNSSEAGKILREKSYKQCDVQSPGRNLCFLFTGQGSQYPNMARQLYQTSPVFRDNFDRCDQVLQKRLKFSMKNILWSNNSTGNKEELNRTIYSQTSIFVVEYCLLQLWMSWGVKPDYVLGHSLGEFAAAVAAGALDFEDALMLVAERSRLIDNLPRGKMLVIKADQKTVDEAISVFGRIKPNFWVDYAALNSPEQTVVAGDSVMIEEFSRFCGDQLKLKTIVLAATHAFHSRHMDAMLGAYRKVAITVKTPPQRGYAFPKFISSVEGKVLDLEEIDVEYWIRHTREKVRFTDACKSVVQDEGCTLFLEIGPHPVLSALTMMNSSEDGGNKITCLPSIRRNEDEWVTILDSLAKLYLSPWKGEIDWKGFDQFYTRRRVNLPFYPFNRKATWALVERRNAKIHPLLGSKITNASSETIFENSVTLKNTNFIQDHVIGNSVIFPGAGYLEMCLAGGHAMVQGLMKELVKPKRPILLKSLKITSPMALNESGVCKVQTLVALNEKDDNEELGYSVGVHRLVENSEDEGKWVQHASAKFLPIATTLPEAIDIEMVQSNWEKSDNREFYDRLPDLGLRFGPKFQSLEGGWKNEEGILLEVKVPQDYGDFLIHPIIADAMIQAVMLWESRGKVRKKLQIPVQICEFLWLKEAVSPKLYVYCNGGSCTLVDETGSPLALMKGVDFMETTSKLVEEMITQETTRNLPNMWEEVWKPCRGPMQGSLRHELTPLQAMDFNEDDRKYFEEKNNLPEEELKFYENLVKLSRYSFLRALYDLGWKPEIEGTFSVDDLLGTLKIRKDFKQYVEFFLRSMTRKNCGMLMMTVEERFQLLKPLPTNEDLNDALKYLMTPKEMERQEYRLLMELDKNLSGILSGDVNPLGVLFPKDGGSPSAGHFYECRREQQSIRSAVIKSLKHMENAVKEFQSPCRPIYRVLEIGAGMGTFTKEYLKEMMPLMKEKNSCDMEYYYTDISAAFSSSMEEFSNVKDVRMIFKKYDMEEDPLEQGLCPEYFDAIFAFEVIHVAKDVRKTMKSLRSLLKPGGLMGIYETICPDERITFIFGLLDGYWRFEDKEFRKYHTTLTPQMWTDVLEETGYHGVAFTPSYNDVYGCITAHALPVENNFLVHLRPVMSSWIIFGDVDDEFSKKLCKNICNVNRKCCIVPKMNGEVRESFMKTYLQTAVTVALEGVDNLEGVIYLWSLLSPGRDQHEISLPFLSLMQLLSDFKTVPKVFAVMKGACGITDVSNPSAGTLVGFCRAVANENLQLNVTYLDLDPNREDTDQLNEVFLNLWVEHKQGAIFRNGLRLRPKLKVGAVKGDEALSLPNGCNRFQLILPKTRLISDLEFAYLEPYERIAENEVEVQVKAMALNFRDVFAVLKPIPAFEKLNSVGLDFSGVIMKVGEKVKKVKVGDRVCGMVRENDLSFPSHYKAGESNVIPLPDGMTFAEGVTLPAVSFTAIHCLINIAKMKKGETILIHTASGGVGLAAIQLCRYVGANVIATAGSHRKRTYLRNLGIEHVFHSRTTDFKNDILEVTKGQGVDVVLNSITGPGFKEASLDCLAKNGRFIEMSKLNVWTTDEVKALRPDVFYEIVDLTTISQEQYEGLSNDLREFIEAGVIRPIPYERFDALNIRGALNYLQGARHIGKIVCIMPEVKVEKSNLIVTTPLFNGESTYLVTGGLGGIGHEIVKWMLRNEAKHICIASRSNPKPEMASQIQTWNDEGCHVRCFKADVGNYEECKALVEKLKNPAEGFPPLRGVMHAAGVLKDAVLENQSWEKFLHTYNPKVNGSWNLHDLTKDYLLEHFVFFSSVTSRLGSPGQTNHSASNAFEDALASYRISQGLPATSINWGNWGEVGVATEVDFPGIRPISTAQGLAALEKFLKTQTSHMTVLNVDSFSLVVKLFPQIKHYLDDSRLFGDNAKTSNMIMNSDDFWKRVESAGDREEKLECFKEFIKNVIRNILKMGEDEGIDDQTELQVLGIDSLMMLEMKNGIQNILGDRMTLTASHIKDCNTTSALANKLVDMLMGKVDSKLSQEDLKKLIREDSKLVLPEIIASEVKPLDLVERVLLTGATGNLGPYLLRELTEKAQVRKVYCLVRSTKEESSLERLSKRLEQLELTSSVDMGKVEVIDGDIVLENFGLEEELYSRLSQDVDAIIHSAVRSDHTAKYWKAPESNKSHVRTVNVLGTARLLTFASEKKLKHFFHASTILTFTGTGEGDGNYSEGWQDVSAFDTIKIGSLGYVLSKHISEQLVHQALGKGIPCKVFRFPYIAGDSHTGRQLGHQQNHFILRWLACMKIHLFHDVPVPFTTIPVDHCAKLSLDIFFNREAPMDVYNVVQKCFDSEQVIVDVASSFGINLEITSYEKVMEQLKSEDEKSPIAQFIDAYVEDDAEFVDTFKNPSIPWLKKFYYDGKNFVDTEKLMKYAKDYENLMESASDVLKRDFEYLKKEGVFAKYGIQTT